jgi:hypothetical protein
MNPSDFQRAIAVLVEHGAPELSGPIVAAWHKYLSTGADVAATLGLTRRARKRFILAERNARLRHALLLCNGKTISQKARRLHLAVEAFRDETWPRLRLLEAPPDKLPPLQKLLFEAFRLAVYDGMPGTSRAIEQICGCEIENGIDFETKTEFALGDRTKSGAYDDGVTSNQTIAEGGNHGSESIQERIPGHRRRAARGRPSPSGRRARKRC